LIGVILGGNIAQRSDRHRQCGEPLLAVDDPELTEIMQRIGVTLDRHDAAYEVAGNIAAFRQRPVLFNDVFPKIVLLPGLPPIVALV
jgi:hypothetical protein